MTKADILEDAVTLEEHSLRELQRWLQYGKHTWSLAAGTLWFAYGLILLAFKIIALLFTPYMLYHLYKAKWYKSVVVLLALVVLPFLASQFIEINNIFDFLLSLFPLFTFYIYAYIISYMIGEQLNEIKTVNKWKREEMLRN